MLLRLLFIPRVRAMTTHETHTGGVPIPVVPTVNDVYILLRISSVTIRNGTERNTTYMNTTYVVLPCHIPRK